MELPVPPAWSQYSGLEAPYPLLEFEDAGRLQHLKLIDMKSGAQRNLWEMPMGPTKMGSPDSRWSPDGRHVLLVNVSVPISADRPESRRMGYLVDYEVSSGRWTILEPMARGESAASEARGEYTRSIYKVEWVASDQVLLQYLDTSARPIRLGEKVLYTWTEGRWSSNIAPSSVQFEPTKSRSLSGNLRVSVRDGANDPPALVASNGQRELTLMSAGPKTGQVWRAQLEEVEWHERAGHIQKGGLMLPRRGAAGAPYPLVIQLDYTPGHFLPDGSAATAYAAQALVAEGMAVLQLDPFPPPSYYASFEDASGTALTVDRAPWLRGPGLVERIDAAVEMLSRQGLIDPQRVGLVGFSYSGFAVSYAITHPHQVVPAAAIVADSVLRNYSEVTSNEAVFSVGLGNDHGSIAVDFNNWYGGSFWQQDARARWLEHAPAFNVNHVETPTLFVYNRTLGANADYLTEMIGAFRQNNKEMDLMQIPNSDHQLARPRQREASMQATLEWMAFWLQSREAASPEKAEQYWYWRALRSHKEARQAKNKRTAEHNLPSTQRPISEDHPAP
jgi:dipeptidyl aminopeptidase/acylaminoacyl peptidase